MKTAQDILNAMKADKCLTASRSRSKKKHRNFSNKYTQLLGEMGYNGIDKNGYFTKFYSYGVVGHCCPFVLYHLIKAGYSGCAPKKKYIWNTNRYAKWLKTEPTIKGLGKVDWTTDIAKAKKAVRAGKLVITFMGSKKAKSYNHTCTLLDIADGYVKTVDGNVKGKYNGKKINNGVIKKRKKSKHKWGFAIMPIPVAKKPAVKPPAYSVGKTYTLQANMNIRTGHSKSSKIKTVIKRGEKVKALDVYKDGSTYWIKTSFGWVCAKTSSKTYLK